MTQTKTHTNTVNVKMFVLTPAGDYLNAFFASYRSFEIHTHSLHRHTSEIIIMMQIIVHSIYIIAVHMPTSVQVMYEYYELTAIFSI